MKITQPKQPATLALNASASGVSVSDPGGVFGGDPITLQQVIDLIAAGGLAGYLTVIRGGQGTTQDLGTLGATATVDLANANYFFGTLAEDCTISTTGWTADKDSQITVELTEDGTGGWTPTFDGVTWIGGTPTWDTTLDTVTIAILFSRDGGTTIYGAVVGSGGSSFALTVEDEGTPLATAADTLDFVGGGVTATGTGATKTITIPGVSGGPGDPGADVVLVTSGFGSVTIPGMEGSPDQVPASPGAADDEFETLTGWSTLGSLDTDNVTDAASHLHIGNTSIGYAVNGHYKACPSLPFTVTVKLASADLAVNFVQAGLMLLDTTPTALYIAGPLFGGFGAYPNDFAIGKWTNRTTRASATDAQVLSQASGPFYYRLVVHSSTDVDVAYSWNGFDYVTVLTAQNPGFTVAKVGLCVAGNTAGVRVGAWWDWIRFS